MRRIDDFLKRIDSADLVMKPHWAKYAMKRLRWRKADGSETEDYELKDSLCKIVVYNGLLGSELEKQYLHPREVEVEMVFGKERAFLDEKDGVLSIAQPVSETRCNRYEDMIYTGCVLSCNDWHIELESLLINGSKQLTLRKYKENAFDFVGSLSVAHNGLKGIDYIVIGPLDWFQAYAEGAIIHEYGNNEYLRYMISEIDNRKILNLDYLYADQSKNILDSLLALYHGKVSDSNIPRRKINVLFYGKVGGLHPWQNINQIVIPNGVTSDYNIEHESHSCIELTNVFAGNERKPNYALNSVSVPLQRRSILMGARAKGCSITEMELYYVTQSINTARSLYHNLQIIQGFAGFISDTPLKGKTLADELDHRAGRKACVKLVTQHIKQNN